MTAGDGPTVAVKDIIDVAGSVTTAGCRTLADIGTVAERDAACISRVRRGGGRLAGKTNLHELAFGTSGINPWFGTPPNPADQGRVPGGSSSGSAAAVGLGEADVALGSDTGGSIRIPAACCGVAGLKTTYGRISLDGVWPLAPSYDTVGVLGADVGHVVVGMALLEAGFALAGEVPETVGRLVLPGDVAREIDPVIEAAIASALASAGLRSETVRLDGWREAWVAQQRLLCEEAWECDRHLLDYEGGAGVSKEIRARLVSGSGFSAAQLEAANDVGRSWPAQLAAAARRHGVLALPTLARRPPLLDEFAPGFNLLTAPVNLAGFPAISIPVPCAERDRPPAGLQLIGLPGTEELLCAVAARVEAAVA